MAPLLMLLWIAIPTLFAKKPNVLIIYCDDSGKEIGIYGGGGNNVKTPNIDYLANHSMVFNYGYTSVSSCSPSRSALLTGLPVHQNGMYGLHSGGPGDHFNSFGNASAPITQQQHPLSISILLRDNGYYTGNIGKYHVGPMNVYYFDYMRNAESGYNGMQVGRNITLMKEYMIDFFENQLPSKDTPWLLYMAPVDTHRGCGGNQGPFCNYWGNGTESMGTIPDWTPITYDPATLKLPYWIPDTPQARQDYADYFETYSRLDQGVGLFIDQIKQRGYLNDTLIIFSSDNGEPFPSAKTNLYEQGQIEPYFISIPEYWQHGYDAPIFSDYMVSTTDVLPTVLEWCDISYPNYTLNGKQVVLTGESLLSVVTNKQTNNERKSNIFGSHIFHESTMYYPMRTARNQQYRLIHNLNWQAPFHI
eukprot:71593_1